MLPAHRSFTRQVLSGCPGPVVADRPWRKRFRTERPFDRVGIRSGWKSRRRRWSIRRSLTVQRHHSENVRWLLRGVTGGVPLHCRRTRCENGGQHGQHGGFDTEQWNVGERESDKGHRQHPQHDVRYPSVPQVFSRLHTPTTVRVLYNFFGDVSPSVSPCSRTSHAGTPIVQDERDSEHGQRDEGEFDGERSQQVRIERPMEEEHVRA